MNEVLAREIYERSRSLPVMERPGFLDRACRGDGDLRERVEALLAAHEAVGVFLAEPTGVGTERSSEVEATEASGTVIGNYKLLQQIGEGGMGTVWMADQFQPVRRKVALKIIKLGMDTKQVIVRFEAERQALALMDHPNIATVLDGGVTKGGRPYFVMELVKGIPLTDFCDQAKLGIRGRLELFVRVCQAVQHAHQKGIVHRDLKPTNILVTLHDGEPVPKVIDFGIAKATNQQLTQKTMFTEFQQILGTPEYMAPEQASMSGLDVDTRADVYSLGVLLYELLTGTKPFDMRTLLAKGYGEMLRTLREEDPPRPSTRASTVKDETGRISIARQLDEGQLGRVLRGDLDWIVVKSMDKDRNRRYETANALAADIGRYLAHEPVYATPPSASYRARKFVRRHRGPVLAAALTLVMLLLGVVGTTLGLVRAKSETRRAEQAELETQHELGRARQVKGLIKGMLLGIKPEEAQGADTTLLKGIVDETARRLGDGDVLDERILAEMHLLLGHAYTALAEFAPAEEHLAKALAISERVFGAEHMDTLNARMQFALLRSEQGAIREAVRMQEEILPALLRAADPDSQEVIGHRINLAMGYHHLKRLDEAEKLAEQGYADARRALGEDAQYTLNAAGNLALIYRDNGRLQEAEALTRRTYERRREILGELHISTISALTRLARVAYERQDYEEADAILRRAIGQTTRVVGEGHPRALEARRQLAHRLLERGHNDEAKRTIEEVIEIAEQTLSPEHFLRLEMQELRARVLMVEGSHGEAARLLLDLAETAHRVLGENTLRAVDFQARIALALVRLGRHAEARRIFERIHAVRQDQLGPDHVRTVAALVGLADGTLRVGRLEEARRLLDDARARIQAPSDASGDLRDWSEQVRARLLAAEGKWEEAAAVFEAVLERRPDDDPQKAEIVLEAVEVALAARQTDAAAALLGRRVALLEKNVGPNDGRTLIAKRNLGELIRSQGRHDEALRILRESVEAMRSHLGPDHPITLESEGLLAIALGARREFKTAERLLLDALERTERTLGAEHLIAADIHRRLGMVYMDWRRLEDAKRSVTTAVELETRLRGTPAFQDLERLGLLAEVDGDLELAERHFRAALTASAPTLRAEDPQRIGLLLGQARVLQGLKRLEEAAAVITPVLEMGGKTLPRTHVHHLEALRQMAQIHQARGRPAQAAPLLEQLVQLGAEAHGAKAPAALFHRPILGLVLTMLGRYEESERVLTEGLQAAQASMGRENPLNGLFLLMLGNAYRAQGKWAEGEKALGEAKASFLRFQGPASPQAMLASITLGGLMLKSERPQEAIAVLEPCLEQMRAELPEGSELFEPATLSLANSYDRAGRIQDAAPLVRQMVEKRSASVEEPDVMRGTLHELADLLLLEAYPETHDPMRAVALAERALAMEREARGGQAWSMLATIARGQHQLGHHEAARASIREAIDLAPQGRRAALEKLRAEIEAAGG